MGEEEAEPLAGLRRDMKWQAAQPTFSCTCLNPLTQVSLQFQIISPCRGRCDRNVLLKHPHNVEGVIAILTWW